MRPRRVARGAIDLDWGSGVCDDVPSLSWFLVSALVPLSLGMTALASVVLGDYARAQHLSERAAKVLPSGVGDELVQLILRTRRDSPLLIAFSIGLMLWTGAGAVGVLERTMSRLLGRERYGQVAGKARHIVLAGGVVVVVVLVVLAGSKATNLPARLGLGDPVSRWAFALASMLATTGVCASLYRLCPRDGVPWRAAVAGAAPAAIALWLTPTATAYYLRSVAGPTPVRVFLVLAGILFTCYAVSMALLIGAAIAVRRVPPA